MTREELKYYNGQHGRKAYVAYGGNVYDVTESPFWRQGEHEGMHYAGEDLTEALENAPHGEEVFKRYEKVGTLDDAPSPMPAGAEKAAKSATAAPMPNTALKTRLQRWYRRYHPHPITVHFPIALHLFAAGLDLLFFVRPTEALAAAVFDTFFVATLGGVVAMIPGILSWWVNYNFILSRPFIVKLGGSILTLILGIIGIMIKWNDPAVAYAYSATGLLYHFCVLATGITVIVIGYYGGKLTWPQRNVEAPEEPAVTDSAFSSAAQHSRNSAADTLHSISILIGGAAGTGIASLEKTLSHAFLQSGYYLFATKEYMSRVRGGSNTTLLRIGDAPINAPCRHVDLFVAVDRDALEHAKERCSERTLLLADESVAAENPDVQPLPMKKTAHRLGSLHYANTYACGVIFGILGLESTRLIESIRMRFSDRDLDQNSEAALQGYAFGTALKHPLKPRLPAASRIEGLRLMNGTSATGFGFLSGGCNFVASYPMSPSTGVLTFMAEMSKHFDLLVEQSEDEIASLNMVLGAWYAGARALATTSGGGFALMGEALSLSGMSETPAVIYLAQRPGPATGMPTRTEQGDYNLARHAGHGDVGRIILAPGDLQECIDCGRLAFEMADRYQMPVILLSDQYLADSVALIAPVDFTHSRVVNRIVTTDETYRRYALDKEGISPRGIPGLGSGLVCADSHEHDPRGQITEDHRMRETMLHKRALKLHAAAANAMAPIQSGEGTIAVVGWGSTKGAIAEALSLLNDTRLFALHFAWVYPLNQTQLAPLASAEHIIVVENNATGQFADALQFMGMRPHARILQANGAPFFVEQLKARIAETVEELQ